VGANFRLGKKGQWLVPLVGMGLGIKDVEPDRPPWQALIITTHFLFDP